MPRTNTRIKQKPDQAATVGYVPNAESQFEDPDPRDVSEAIDLLSSGRGGVVQVTDSIPAAADRAEGGLYLDLADTAFALLGIVTVTYVSANYTALQSDVRISVDCSAGPVTITLPLASDNTKKVFLIHKNEQSANALTVVPTGADTVNLTTSVVFGSFPGSGIFASNPGDWSVH